MSLLLFIMLVSVLLGPGSTAQAAGKTITSMEYFSSADGPVISKSGVGKASFGFVMPKFNGGSLCVERSERGFRC